jgi:hypothetical protein
MKALFEFLFSAKGRINRAQHWRSLVIFGVAGLFAAIILFTAAAIATPLFIVMVVLARCATRSALCCDTPISAPRPRKTKKPDGRFGHRASEFREAWNFPTSF